MTTKKIKHAGRFGAGYGKRIRIKLNEVESKQRKKQECPLCKGTLKREAQGIWKCKKCLKKIAGGTYTFK
ncbi:MAG: 50S ribosomal protein L37ae [Nanoarchaeota archaeon]|nr:50S ribosomal protein L37ae [Nanoarchaeota archaeon]